MRCWAVVTLGLVACTKIDSNNLKIDEMKAEIEVLAKEDGSTKVEVQLTNRNRTLEFVNLQGKDKLFVTAGSTRQEMTKSELLNDISYVASFSGQAATGTNYKVEFVRGDGFKGAPSSSCQIPTSFAISAPAAAQTFARATNDVPVTVTAGNNNYRLKLSGTCINAVDRSVTDAADGSFTILKSELVASTDHATSTCDVTIDLQVASQGTLDPGWGAGSVLCSQTRTRSISSTP